MGKKLFGKEDNPAEKSKEAIDETGLGVGNLNTEFEDRNPVFHWINFSGPDMT
jgi:hypothetical protein